MKSCSIIFLKKIPVFIFFFYAFSLEGKAQITMSTANCSISSNEVQMDILVTNTGTIDLRWNSCVLRMTVPTGMIPPGTQTYAINYIGGSDFPLSWPAVYPATAFGSNYIAATRILTWTTGNTSAYNNLTCTAPLISPGQTKTIGRFSFKITSSTFLQGAAANFVWHSTSGCNFYQGCAAAVTGYYQSSGLRTLINPCALTVPGSCLVTATTGSTAVSCFGTADGTATVTLTGPAGSGDPGTYTIDGGVAQPFTTNPFTIPGLSSGNHIIVIINPVISSSCTVIIVAVNITSPVAFTNSIAVTAASCPGSTDGTATIYLAYGTSGTYTLDGVAPLPYTTNPFLITGLAAGSHNIITAISSGGCVSPNTSFNIGMQANPTASSYKSSSCVATGVIKLHANATVGSYPYSIDGINYQTSNTFTGLAQGAYTGYVKYAGGCVGTVLVYIAKEIFGIDPLAWESSACANTGKIKILPAFRSAGTSPFAYSLDNINYQPGNTFLNLAPGSYTCYMKDALGCLASKNILVPVASAFSVTARHTNASCINDGTIQANDPVGGTAPFSYSLNGITFQTSKSFSGLGAGNYTLYAKDLNNCYATTNITIDVIFLEINSYATNATSCSTNNGKIQLFLYAGTVGPYTYSLDNNNFQVSNVFNNLAPAYYYCYVKDSKGCIGITSALVGPLGCSGPTFTKIAGAAGLNELKVKVYPNPSTEEFTLMLEGYDAKAKVSVIVTDIMGRKVYQAEGTGKQQYRFGKEFMSGIYYVQVIQGAEKKKLALVKE